MVYIRNLFRISNWIQDFTIMVIILWITFNFHKHIIHHITPIHLIRKWWLACPRYLQPIANRIEICNLISLFIKIILLNKITLTIKIRSSLRTTNRMISLFKKNIQTNRKNVRKAKIKIKTIRKYDFCLIICRIHKLKFWWWWFLLFVFFKLSKKKS